MPDTASRAGGSWAMMFVMSLVILLAPALSPPELTMTIFSVLDRG